MGTGVLPAAMASSCIRLSRSLRRFRVFWSIIVGPPPQPCSSGLAAEPRADRVHDSIQCLTPVGVVSASKEGNEIGPVVGMTAKESVPDILVDRAQWLQLRHVIAHRLERNHACSCGRALGPLMLGNRSRTSSGSSSI